MKKIFVLFVCLFVSLNVFAWDKYAPATYFFPIENNNFYGFQAQAGCGTPTPPYENAKDTALCGAKIAYIKVYANNNLLATDYLNSYLDVGRFIDTINTNSNLSQIFQSYLAKNKTIKSVYFFIDAEDYDRPNVVQLGVEVKKSS